jgi:multidrug efflux pump subunit AcrB
MRSIVSSFVEHPFYANMIVAFLLIAGIAGLSRMNKSHFPELDSRFIDISVTYRGASPQEMEEGVTVLLEEALRGIAGIKEFSSVSSENLSKLIIETDGRTSADDVLVEVKNAIDGISNFPAAAERPSVAKRKPVQTVARMSLWGQADIATLKQYADRIEQELLATGAVTQVTVSNRPATEISIEVSDAALSRHQISFRDITRAIRENNIDISSGQIRSGKEELMVRMRNKSVGPEDIMRITVASSATGGSVTIGDIAQVKLQIDENYHHTYVNGQPALDILVQKLHGEDLEAVSKACFQYIEAFNASVPDARLDVSFSAMSNLNSRLDLLIGNGATGLLLVVLSLALFLSFKLSLWVAWGIPAAFLGMFVVAPYVGLTINMISLFGMILVIGILVDDGIVIAENIYSHYEKGKTAKRAAVDGTMEVLAPVLTSVTTTIVAFSPLLMLVGGNMEFLRDMALVVTITLFLSLFEAFFVLPAHLGSDKILKRKPHAAGKINIRNYIDRAIARLRDKLYSRAIVMLTRWRYVAVFVPVFLFMITQGLIQGGFIGFTFFPMVDHDQFTINLAYSPGSGSDATYASLQKFQEAVWEIDEQLKQELGQDSSIILFTFLRVGSAFGGQERGNHAGTIEVQPRNLEGLPISGIRIAEMVRSKIGKVPEASKLSVSGRNRWGNPVSISIMSRSQAELEAARDYLLDKLEQMPELANVLETSSQGKQEINLVLKDKAYALGLTSAEVAAQVRQGFYGDQAQVIQSGRDEIRIWVRYPQSERAHIGLLDAMTIRAGAGLFPLSELCWYDIARGPVSIQRFNGSRETRVEAETARAGAEVPRIIQALREGPVASAKELFPGASFQFMGQQRSSQETGKDLSRLFTLALAVIAFILMMHFRNVEQAIIILLMIPLAILGAAWGHAVHGKIMSILSVWGVVALTGVIINDAVVFLSKFNRLIAAGESFRNSVSEAGKSRLRPIMLTTITTSIGLFPLILETSFQAQFLIPMAISLAYGVAVGTFFILTLFPVLIYLLNDARRLAIYIWTGQRISREQAEPAYKKIAINKKDIPEHGNK